MGFIYIVICQNLDAFLMTFCCVLSLGGSSVITGSNPSQVGMSPRQGSSIIMGSSGGTPTKVYPVSSRDINTTLVETYINQGHVQHQQNHINSPSLTVVPNISNVGYSTPSAIRPTFVLTSSSNSASLKGITPPHQIVQVQAPTNPAGTFPNYYIEPKNLATNVSIYPSLAGGKRISIQDNSGEKRNEKGTLVTSGQMILTSSGQVPDGGGLAAHFAHPVPLQTSSSNQITAHPLSIPKGSPLSIPHSQISIHPHSIPTNVISPAIITTSVTTVTSSVNALTTTNTSIVTLSLNSTGGGGNGGGAAISTITTTSTTIPPPISSGSIPSTTSTPAQSPSQAKSTLSPRPSILRKREAGACETNFVPLRAQRNLSVNFTAGSAPLGLGNNGPISTASPSVLISTVSNKENNSTNLGGGFVNSLGSFGLNVVTPSSSSSGSLGISILKKEFQPPNEESSWQSSSSNSSSTGSTTLSATSETAELPGTDVGFVAYHQPPLPPPTTIGHHNPTNLAGMVIARAQPQNSAFPQISINPVQNGVLVRSRAPPPSAFAGLPSSVAIVSGPHPTPPRHRATSLAKGREPKGRGKDVVSPRKKPRKQQL